MHISFCGEKENWVNTTTSINANLFVDIFQPSILLITSCSEHLFYDTFFIAAMYVQWRQFLKGL